LDSAQIQPNFSVTACKPMGVWQIQDRSCKHVLHSHWTGPNQTTDLRNWSRRGRPFWWELASARRYRSPISWLWRQVLDCISGPENTVLTVTVLAVTNPIIVLQRNQNNLTTYLWR